MNGRLSTALLIVLVMCVAALTYLDWRRQGEIDNLHARLDRLDGGNVAEMPARRGGRETVPSAPRPAAPVPATPAAGSVEPPIPAPERAYSEGDVVADPLPGLVVERTSEGNGSLLEPEEIHPLLRSVMQAHGEA